MRVGIVIPVHNEEDFLRVTLDSLLSQRYLPSKIVLVNDNSTDKSGEIIEEYEREYECVKGVFVSSKEARIPGGKVVHAFNKGLEEIGEADIICKFDADLIFPENYLERMVSYYKRNEKAGMYGGKCSVERNGEWRVENLTDNEHIRGALKSYRRECFEDIGGLKEAMGWDTLDELLARYKGWEVKVSRSLVVKHLRETSTGYTKMAQHMQGEAFYRLGYGVRLTLLASMKMAMKKRKMSYLWEYWQGYLEAHDKKVSYLVTKEESKWIRRYRWRNIFKKLFGVR